MRVTHVMFFGEKPGKHPFSGAENHLWTLLTGLVRCGVEVELIALTLYPGPFLDAKFRELSEAGVRVTQLRRKSFSSIIEKLLFSVLLLLEFFSHLRCRREVPLHIHLDEWFAPFVSVCAGVHHRIISFHCDEPRYRKIHYRLWFKLIDRWVAQYIGITNYVSDYCSANLGLPRRKFKTIYYGVPPPRVPAVTRAMFSVPENGFVVGFVGRLTQQKNLFTFCDALALVPEVHGVIVGGGALELELHQYVVQRSIKNAQFLGARPNAVEIIPIFDVLCLPSIWEGLGLVLIEAMHLGVPVIGSQYGAIPEILEEGRSGMLIDCSAPETLAIGLRKAIEISEERKRVAIVVKERVLSRFSVEEMCRKTAHLYKTTAA